MSYHIRVRAGAVIIRDNSILLIEFNDENGLHYNLPAGGVEPNETIIEAVRREAQEEASIDVEVGPLAFVYEYAPYLNSNKYGETHSLGLMFECRIKEGFSPRLPNNPDKNQTGVKWVKLTDSFWVKSYLKLQMVCLVIHNNPPYFSFLYVKPFIIFSKYYQKR